MNRWKSTCDLNINEYFFLSTKCHGSVGDNSPYGIELRLEDSDSFRNFSRMELAMFDELLHKFRPRSAKQNTWYRQAIRPGKKDSSTVCGVCGGYAALSQ